METMIMLLVYLVVACILFGVAYYVINNIAPEPMRRWLTVILLVIGAIVICYVLLGFVGSGGHIHHLLR